MNDPYCYEGTNILRNKLNIKNEDELNRAEVDFSCNAIHELLVLPLDGKYDFEHFCKFHEYIFKDLYEWAGKPRIIEIEKAESMLGYMSIEYEKPEDIPRVMTSILKDMNNRNWEEMPLKTQAEQLASDMAALWKVHAFREGNTRTIITFICQFADSKGMPMNRELFEKHSAYTRNALVAASAIFAEGDFRKLEYLSKLIEDSLNQRRNE